MNVSQIKKMLSELPPQFDSYNVEFAARVEMVTQDHWVREDHPIAGSFIDQDNRELVLANDEELRKLAQYAAH